jgi:hypothetical protein
MSEALAEACPERNEGTNQILHFVQDDISCQILHGVYPETKTETLRFAQGDSWRRGQNDKNGIPLITTQSLEGRGGIGCVLQRDLERKETFMILIISFAWVDGTARILSQ